MSLQIINSIDGRAEYVLLPVNIYKALRNEINEKLKTKDADKLVAFNSADYIDNPIALARIEAGLSQKQLAKKLKVTQAYISKLERQEKISAKVMCKMKEALKK